MARKKINIITLGCSKNLVDSENIITQLHANNYEIVNNGTIHDARNVVINTCGFINDAKEESIETIMQFAYAKEKKLIDKLFVVGCLAERYRDILRKDIKEVDSFFGVNDLEDIIKSLDGNYKKELYNERVITTPSHYAFLKISEGCNRKCSFCSIPLIRGEYKSVPIENLQQQAEFFATKSVKELILIAQDSSYYGFDLYKQYRLPELLQNLAKIKQFEWIRLHYAYPDNFPMDTIKVMKETPNICKYIDIPFQHISDNVLTMMRRGHDSKKIYELIDYFRKEIPEIAIRTTLILGHPGETDEDFENLKKFVEEVKFDRLGVFAYSEEDGTYGANKYKDEIPKEVKNARAEEIMEIQQQVSFELNQTKIKKTYKVIIDSDEGEFYIGRTEFDTPEVDNEVLISKEKELKIGEFYNVKINYADEFDIFGEVV
jgi:ribosomal protein S12 methylthiotransferase